LLVSIMTGFQEERRVKLNVKGFGGEWTGRQDVVLFYGLPFMRVSRLTSPRRLCFERRALYPSGVSFAFCSRAVGLLRWMRYLVRAAMESYGCCWAVLTTMPMALA
jgi:hypothetical protein